VIVVSAHGGYRGERPPGQPDLLSPYLETIFATIGIHTLLFLRLEGMSRGPEAVTGGLAKARAWIEDELPNLIGPMAVRPQR
jgi:FMN-dependent NADH-azoreductase